MIAFLASPKVWKKLSWNLSLRQDLVAYPRSERPRRRRWHYRSHSHPQLIVEVDSAEMDRSGTRFEAVEIPYTPPCVQRTS